MGCGYDFSVCAWILGVVDSSRGCVLVGCLFRLVVLVVFKLLAGSV